MSFTFQPKSLAPSPATHPSSAECLRSGNHQSVVDQPRRTQFSSPFSIHAILSSSPSSAAPSAARFLTPFSYRQLLFDSERCQVDNSTPQAHRFQHLPVFSSQWQSEPGSGRRNDNRKESGNVPKRSRTVFTPVQLERLENAFSKQQYVAGEQRRRLAASLRLTETHVKVWFQNRRIRFRKHSQHESSIKPKIGD